MNISSIIFLITGISVIVFAVYLRLKALKKGNKLSFEDNYSVLEVKITRTEEEPKNILLAALAAENLFSSLHGLLKENY